MPDSTYLTLQEAAKFLRLSRSRTYELVERGVIPARQIGGRGRLLFSRAELDAALTPKKANAQG